MSVPQKFEFDPEKPEHLAPAEVQGYVRLPVTYEQFKEFITSLLGVPQSITNQVSGSFNMEASDHYLCTFPIEANLKA
jgi:hypothetical protein